MRGARAAALLLVLPFAGCIFAVDHGGRKGLEKRVERLEKRIQDLERNPPPMVIHMTQGEEPAR